MACASQMCKRSPKETSRTTTRQRRSDDNKVADRGHTTLTQPNATINATASTPTTTFRHCMCIGMQVCTSGTLKRVGAYVGLRESVPSGRIRRRRQGEDEGEDEQEDERDDEGGPADKQKPEMKTNFLPSLACTL